MATCCSYLTLSALHPNPIDSPGSVGPACPWFPVVSARFNVLAFSEPRGWKGGFSWDRCASAERFKLRWRVAEAKVEVSKSDNDGVSDATPVGFDISRLEAYTEGAREEVLCVNAMVDDEEDQVIVFKGFSSSLMRETPDDPEVPVLPFTAVILSVDRLRGPYNPSKPKYIQRDMSWLDFHRFLQEKGL